MYEVDFKKEAIRFVLGAFGCLAATVLVSVLWGKDLSAAWIALMIFIGFLFIRMKPPANMLIVLLFISIALAVVGALVLAIAPGPA